MAVAVIPAPALNDTFEFKLFCQYTPQFSCNVLHYKIVALNGGVVTLEEMADALSLQLAPAWKPLFFTSASYYGALMRRVAPDATLQAQTKQGAGPGTAGTSAAPPSGSMYVTTTTGQPGRKNRGRIYFPFPPIQFLDVGGNLDAAGSAAIQLSMNTILQTHVVSGASGGTVTLQYAIYNRAAKTSQPASQYFIRTHLGTQVRRGFAKPNDRPPF